MGNGKKRVRAVRLPLSARPEDAPEKEVKAENPDEKKETTISEFIGEMDDDLAMLSANLFGDDEVISETPAPPAPKAEETAETKVIDKVVTVSSSPARHIEREQTREQTREMRAVGSNTAHIGRSERTRGIKRLSAFSSTLRLTETPHLHSPDNTRSIMVNTLLALCPMFLWGIYAFGFRVLLLTIISVASCVGFEAAAETVFGRRVTVSDCSAVVTAVISVFLMPASAPLWMPVFSAFLSIVLAKQLFGGIGRNIVNPAIFARLVTSALFPKYMTEVPLFRYEVSVFDIAPVFSKPDKTTLMLLRGGNLAETTLLSEFFGGAPGCIGEISAFLIIAAFVYLVATKTIKWQTPVVFTLTSAVLFFAFPRLKISTDMLALRFAGYEIFTGAFMLGAVFLASEYGSTPKTTGGKVIFGAGCGVLTVLFRYFLPTYDGVCLAIFIASLFSRPLDKLLRPAPYGTFIRREEAKEKEKEKGSAESTARGKR